MIVWGGTYDYTIGLNTGGVYDPASNSWTTTTTTNAPSARFYHTMVRSGSKVIVWGGTLDDTVGLNTGGIYDPVGDSWTAINTAGAPSARLLHRAVRQGNAENMIVWGGTPDYTTTLNTGGIYDPALNSWTTMTTTNAPSARAEHSAVFAPNIGMIVWGGTPDGNTGLKTGGIYHALVDSWTATSTVGAPSARIDNSAEWTGTEMIVWGGSPNYTTTTTLKTGGRYDPATDTWAATTTTNAPSARGYHRSDWTGTEMIVWGGTPDYASTLNTGGRYTP
jgi:N-acetylneuraminic acid mutarotase